MSNIENLDYDDDNDFLNELSKDVFVSQADLEKREKERIQKEKEDEKEYKRQARFENLQNKQLKMNKKEVEDQAKKIEKEKKEEEDKLFSEKRTKIYGRDRLQLIAKINQYKVLFPENKQLKDLKVKRNAKVEELQAYLAECEAIVDTDVVESFMTDSLLQAIKMVEMGSTKTKYNIKGLSDALKANPQFNILCKQLYLKYKIFSKVPPEAQLGLLVISTTYVILDKNKNEATKEEIYNKPIDITSEF